VEIKSVLIFFAGLI